MTSYSRRSMSELDDGSAPLISILLAGVMATSGCSSTYAFFSDEDNLDQRAADEIAATTEFLHAAVYSFSLGAGNGAVYDEILSLDDRRVPVQLCSDSDQASPYASSTSFENLGDLDEREHIQVRICEGLNTSDPYASMHNKFMILDGATVLTGSYNYTSNATEDNWENLLVLHDKALAASYDDAFERIWAECTDFSDYQWGD